MTAPVLAALASIPSRADFLERVLGSLRPQVDRLCVYLNGYRSVPAIVRELADEHVVDPVNAGAERKFHWAGQHQGLYLSCDDDIVYPPDYAATMLAAAGDGRQIVTAHGRCYLGRPSHVREVEPGSIGLFHKRVDASRPINHGGTGVMGWDTRRVAVPAVWPLRNIADMQLAIWAQLERVPLWLVAHQAHWLRPLALVDPRGLFKTSQASDHRQRNELLAEHGRTHGWRMWS